MSNVSSEITGFSKHLLVTIFAIFAFTSGALLSATSILVKVTFLCSLLFTLLSMMCGFQVIMKKTNYYISNPNETGELSKDVIKDMKSKLQWQYYWSMGALFTLIISIGLFFATDNYHVISVMP
jgi:hypothetical protein